MNILKIILLIELMFVMAVMSEEVCSTEGKTKLTDWGQSQLLGITCNPYTAYKHESDIKYIVKGDFKFDWNGKTVGTFETQTISI